MPRASTKVFKKRRGVFNKGRCNKSNDGCGESNSTVPKNSADEKIVLMVQSFVLMKLNHLPKCDSSENYELNTRLVYAMRCIGKGAESARMFCGIMNLSPPPTKFSKYNHILLQATRETCEHSMAEAVREAVDENDGKKDLAVAVDGSWQKRGFSSKNDLLTDTSVDTGKVIDVEVFSKHCICPNKTKHLQNSKRNFEGYSGKMEVAGALSIFQRSLTMFGTSLSTMFVMKRIGTRLRRLKTKMRGQKLSDGKPLCGRNRLTEAEIDRLQAYYGLAIRRNLSSVKDMQQAIWAIFLHKLSTDEKPQHGFCPSDSDTWDLANPELLKKCLHGGTQNPNESVNNVIWSRVPKKTFVQLEVLSLGTYDAVSSFNMGNVLKLEILSKMCIEPGDYTVQAMECLDKQRLLRAKYYCLQKTKEVRKEKRLKRTKEDDELLKNADNLEYGAKMF
ncbi:uncharacterized protein TNCV_53851 [Trichonephila clavipes]|nr:uncharacterized protein TNCV_53851 [Trichonephila clavipes]